MLSVIIVNYNSAGLLKECYSSIVSTVNCPIEFIFVDSGSKEDDANELRNLEGAGIKVIFLGENLGYASALNAGIENAGGDFILMTNPDVVYRPHSIKIMMNALSNLSRCGAVGPRTWWDREKIFMLPFSELITPLWIIRTELMRVSRTFRDTILKKWIKEALRYWLSGQPVRQEMISGACIMTTRSILDVVGGFDGSFPLYFEDTDWCMRVRKAGYHLYMLPEAGLVHYYNQSSQHERTASMEKYNYSLHKYMQKYFKGRFYLTNLVQKFLAKKQYKKEEVYVDLGALTEPPVFRFRDSSRKLLLLSPLDTLRPSAGAIFDESVFGVPKELWYRLGEGRYFLKVVYLDELVDCGAWSWERVYSR